MQLPTDIELDHIDSVAAQSPVLNSFTGTLGKAFDTFVDALAVQGAGKLVGTVYPTGQQDPAAAKAAASAATAQQANTAIQPQTLIVYGGIALVGIVGLIVVLKVVNK